MVTLLANRQQENGYGFEYSVVKSSFSYGGERGLYEFAGYDEVGEMVRKSTRLADTRSHRHGRELKGE